MRRPRADLADAFLGRAWLIRQWVGCGGWTVESVTDGRRSWDHGSSVPPPAEQTETPPLPQPGSRMTDGLEKREQRPISHPQIHYANGQRS